jgi:RNA chaperone Hfq
MSKHPINVQGRIKRFDRYAIVLQIDEKEVLIYKHAIATVAELPD